MINTDKFIERVHSIPALWNISYEEYLNKNTRDRAWIDITNFSFESMVCSKQFFDTN